jgi:hypothetical protein
MANYQKLALPALMAMLVALAPGNHAQRKLKTETVDSSSVLSARPFITERASRGGTRTTTAPTTTEAAKPTTTLPVAKASAEPEHKTLTAAPFRKLRDAQRPTTTTASRTVSVNSFLRCVRWHESRDHYDAVNPRSTASGGYQMLDSTWHATLRHAGRTGPSRAYLASPAFQDEMALVLYNWQGRSPWNGTGC